MTANPRFGVKIDHVTTIRNARGGITPDLGHATRLAPGAAADGIDLPLDFEVATTPPVPRSSSVGM